MRPLIVYWLIFQAKGANIGDVYVATEFANRDRRIPIPVRKENEPHLNFICLMLGVCGVLSTDVLRQW